ncbi:AAA family ATPase (plasmid) [Morganella morganii]
MSVYLENIQIKKLFDEKNINWKLNDVSVLVGKNGAGKSTILRSVYELLTDSEQEHLNLSTECTLKFSGNSSIKFKKNKLDFSKKEIASIFDLIVKQTEKELQKNARNKRNKATIESKETSNQIISLYKKMRSNPDGIQAMFFTDITKENEKRISDISIEMISTINMNANSINELTKSNGNTTTLLDIELNSEIEKLKLKKNDSIMIQKINTFINELNDFFEECNKIAEFKTDKILIKHKETGKNINIRNLSSGERQLLFILIKALNNSCERNILLMDEPEISLHMSWQKKLISSIKKINEKCQLIIVTHSASILAKGWIDSFVDIKNIESKAD